MTAGEIKRVSSRQFIDIELHKASDLIDDDLILALTRIVEYSFELGGEANSASLARFMAKNTSGLRIAISGKKRTCRITRKNDHLGDCTLEMKGDWYKYKAPKREAKKQSTAKSNKVIENKKPSKSNTARSKKHSQPTDLTRLSSKFFCPKCSSAVNKGWRSKSGNKICDLCEARTREYKEPSDHSNSRIFIQGGGIETNRRKF